MKRNPTFARPHRPIAALVLAATLLVSALPSSAAAASEPAPAAAHTAASGVYYEIFVRSWFDTDNDGIGDINGVTAKLDYLASLGVSGIWLTPINPSPSYHGYDVTDYYGINPQFGSMADFEHLLHEAHRRGIKVLMDLVINHTSDLNPWFRRAIDPRSPYHGWYSWADKTTDLAAENPWGGQVWHALGDQHYLGVFSAQMPDLNYDTPAVREAMIKVGRFWLAKGVDGFRLDAAKHIYVNLRADDGNPQAIARNLAWWKQFRAAMRRTDPHVFLVGEVSADREAQLAPYYAALDSVFNFPLAAGLVHSADSEQSPNLGARLGQAEASFRAQAGGPVVDTPFLTNHDQNRVYSDLRRNAQHMRMAAAMLMTLPGRPFVYYGEEIGMTGTKPDPEIREPMRWQRSTIAPGETRWEEADHNADPAVSVAAEAAAPDSLLNFYRRAIRWRSDLPALRDGTIAAYPADGGALAAYVRRDAHQILLVVHNLGADTRRIRLSKADGHRFAHLLRRTRNDVRLDRRSLVMPAYSTAILE